MQCMLTLTFGSIYWLMQCMKRCVCVGEFEEKNVLYILFKIGVIFVSLSSQ